MLEGSVIPELVQPMTGGVVLMKTLHNQNGRGQYLMRTVLLTWTVTSLVLSVDTFLKFSSDTIKSSLVKCLPVITRNTDTGTPCSFVRVHCLFTRPSFFGTCCLFAAPCVASIDQPDDAFDFVIFQFWVTFHRIDVLRKL